MKISHKTEYALLAILDLSLQSPDDVVKGASIAARQGIPKKFLGLVLAELRQGGFVVALRGPEGGYRLARPAERITVGDIVACIEHHGNGKRIAHDAFTPMWEQVYESISAVIDQTSFADMAERWKQANSRYAPDWVI